MRGPADIMITYLFLSVPSFSFPSVSFLFLSFPSSLFLAFPCLSLLFLAFLSFLFLAFPSLSSFSLLFLPFPSLSFLFVPVDEYDLDSPEMSWACPYPPYRRHANKPSTRYLQCVVSRSKQFMHVKSCKYLSIGNDFIRCQSVLVSTGLQRKGLSGGTPIPEFYVRWIPGGTPTYFLLLVLATSQASNDGLHGTDSAGQLLHLQWSRKELFPFQFREQGRSSHLSQLAWFNTLA